jgi:hypothetical protein
MNNGSYPHVEIIGPFTYREVNHKFDIEWNADDSIVRYKYNRTFFLLDKICDAPVNDSFEPPDCTLLDNMTVMTGNAALVGFAGQLIAKLNPTTDELKLIVGEIIEFIIDEFNKRNFTGNT